MFEGIVTKRLIALLHDRQLIEPQQYTSTQDRDTSQALLDMTLDIYQGLKKGEDTGAKHPLLPSSWLRRKKIKKFDEQIWQQEATKIMKAGLVLKFENNVE